MIIINDKNRILNLNHLAIYIMLSESEEREYGKKLITKFSVEADGSTNINSDDDQMLANTVNAYVQKSIGDLYGSYVELAKSGTIYDVVLGYVEEK